MVAMSEIMLGIIASTLVSFGVYVSTQWDTSEMFDEEPTYWRTKAKPKQPMILWWVRWYGSYLPYQLRKPIYFCLPCMASIWSIPSFIYLDLPLVAYPFFALAVCGLNSLVRYNLNT
jgi:hypothetical protein